MVPYYFGRTSLVSQQLYHYATDPESDLHQYQEGFLEARDAALALTVERATEREHLLVKTNSKRGTKVLDPGHVCSRKRKRQIDDDLDNQDCLRHGSCFLFQS